MKVAQVKNKMEEAGPYSAKGRKVEEGNTDRECSRLLTTLSDTDTFGKGLEAVGESKKDLWGESRTVC